MSNEFNVYVTQVNCDKYITCIINAVHVDTTEIIMSSVQDNYCATDARDQLTYVIKSLRNDHNAKAVNLIETNA